MSIGYSSIELIGYLGQDPRPIQSGDQVKGSRFSIAVNRVWTDESGERQETTEWFNVVAWGQLAEQCKSSLHKGQLVYVEGRMKTREWTADDGTSRSCAEVAAQDVFGLEAAAN